MKVYFSGSINGGMQDANFYKWVINYLKVAHNVTVLTERLWDEDIHAGLEKGVTPEGYEHLLSATTTYLQDCEWLKQADLVIADVSTPSHGVGYEIGLAESCNKPIICLYNKLSPKKISWMISGNPNIIVIEYSKEALPDLLISLSTYIGV